MRELQRLDHGAVLFDALVGVVSRQCERLLGDLDLQYRIFAVARRDQL
jgi:hypothetical protein